MTKKRHKITKETQNNQEISTKSLQRDSKCPKSAQKDHKETRNKYKKGQNNQTEIQNDHKRHTITTKRLNMTKK